MYKLLIFVAFVTLAKSHDVIIGPNEEGKKIFDEERQAGAGIIWRQIQNVTINASDDEIISKIIVTDLRSDKEGHARIVEGGKGQKYVTLELKSPSLLTGFDFRVEVYSATEDKARISTSTTTRKTPYNEKDQANIYPPILSSSYPEDTIARSISQDTKTNNVKKSVEANAENVPRITVDHSGKTLETKANETLNNNEQRTPYDFTHEDGHRHIRDAAKERDEKSNEPNVHNDKMYTGIPNFPEHTTATEPLKQREHAENSERASPKFNADSILSAVSGGKRDDRDTDSKHNADYLKTTAKSENSGQNSSKVPPPQTSGIPTAPHDFNRQLTLGEGYNNSETYNNGATLPVELAKVSSNKNNTSDKERMARDTQEKSKAALPPTIITNEGPKFTLPHVNSDDPEEEKVNVYPPMEITKRNDTANPANHRSFAPIPYADLTSPSTTEKSQNKRDTEQKLLQKENKELILKNTPQSDDPEEEKVNVYPPMEETKRNDTANPANHRSFAPIPYADLTSPSTTEKSQNKRDTEQKLLQKENKELILKNTPQTFGQQKHTHEKKPVISIQ